TLHTAIEVRLQLFRELLARRFVRRKFFVAKREPGIVDPAEIIGAVILHEALQKVHDAPSGGRVLATARGERARGERKERAMDQRVAVDEKEPRRWWRACHPLNVGAGGGAFNPRRCGCAIPKTAPPAGVGGRCRKSTFVEATVRRVL